MSIRSGVSKALAANISAALDGTNPNYLSNLYTNVTNRVVHFSNVPDFPYVSVTPGPEYREDQPSNFSWGFLTLNIRIFVQNEDDAQGELEQIISDIENYIDANINIDYTIERPSGSETSSTTDITIKSITTDEGLLSPKGLGEIVLNVRYEKNRQFS